MGCIRIGNGIVCIDPVYMIRDEKGKEWRFEWNDFHGPTALHPKTDEPLKPPPEKSSFWSAVGAWNAQGRKTKELRGEAWALWDPRRAERDLRARGGRIVLKRIRNGR